MQWEIRGKTQRAHQRLRQLERDAGAAEVLILRLAVGAARIDHGVRRRQRVARQVVVGDDDVDPGGTGGGDRGDCRNAAVARHDQAGTDALRFRQARRPEVVAIADAVGDERMHRGTGAAKNAREHGRRALAVHVVVAVHQDRLLFTDRAHQQPHGDRHVGPAMRVGEALEVGAQERFCRLGGCQPALHENRGERVGDLELRGEDAGRVRIRVRGEDPAGRNHSLAYNNTPQASHPSMVAPR